MNLNMDLLFPPSEGAHAEHGDIEQTGAADSLQHPGGRAGGPGPGDRCPQGKYSHAGRC